MPCGYRAPACPAKVSWDDTSRNTVYSRAEIGQAVGVPKQAAEHPTAAIVLCRWIEGTPPQRRETSDAIAPIERNADGVLL